jgi:hypothetical protein
MRCILGRHGRDSSKILVGRSDVLFCRSREEAFPAPSFVADHVCLDIIVF